MQRIISLVVTALVTTVAPASAQWSLAWGTDAAPACFNGGSGPTCLSGRLDYHADGTATFTLWSRENTTANTTGSVDAIAFSGLAAPTVTSFSLTKPGGGAVTGWSYGTPPLGSLGSWGWGVDGGGITDASYTGGGSDSKTFATSWGGSFAAGGGATFSFFLGTGIPAPTQPVLLSAHVRDAYYDSTLKQLTSDRFTCADVGSATDGCSGATPVVIAEVVPEPATMALLATGLLGLSVASLTKRRRRPGIDAEG